MKRAAEYRELAREVMEPVLTVAGRRLELAVEEIYQTQVLPLRRVINSAEHALSMAHPEHAREILRAAMEKTGGRP